MIYAINVHAVVKGSTDVTMVRTTGISIPPTVGMGLRFKDHCWRIASVMADTITYAGDTGLVHVYLDIPTYSESPRDVREFSVKEELKKLIEVGFCCIDDEVPSWAESVFDEARD